MGVDAAETGQSSRCHTLGHDAWYENLVVIADDDTGHLAFAVDKEADLAPDVAGNADDIPREFR